MQLDQSKMYSITIIFRSWSCSFPPEEVMDQSTVQNSQTVLVALLSLMQLVKVSNEDRGGENNLCFIVSMIIPAPFFGGMRLQKHRVYFIIRTKACGYIPLVFLQFSSMKSGSHAFHVGTC